MLPNQALIAHHVRARGSEAGTAARNLAGVFESSAPSHQCVIYLGARIVCDTA